MRQEQSGPGVPTVLTIVEALAAREGVDPMELEPTLSDAVAPDPLEALLSRGAATQSHVTVTFEWGDYDVVVGSDGTLGVRPRRARVNP